MKSQNDLGSILVVRTAVILAAGMGKRLGSLSKGYPKGFLEIGGQTLIERSISNLKASGIEKIILGVGFQQLHYESLCQKWPEITLVRNSHYASTGSFYTFISVLKEVKEDILLLESDLLYEKRALDLLLNHSQKNLVLGSDMTHHGDEVFLEFDKENTLIGVSKNKDDLKEPTSVLVGINKLSKDTLHHLKTWRSQHEVQSNTIDYECVFPGLEPNHRVQVLHVPNLHWCEVDNEAHYQRAIQEVLPHITESQP
jgi:2-aminoethylphosphonate-pyruvate transaminase